MKISIDNRVENLNDEKSFSNAKKELALIYVEKLNGKQHTLLTLERKDGTVMQIGGGNNGKYIVTVCSINDTWTLHGDSNENIDIELCAGGQYADFPSKMVVNIEDVKQSLEKFYQHQESQLRLVNE